MATQAKITSTEALETFRAALIVFLDRSRRALDDAGDEFRRLRQWIQQDQRIHWEGEFRRRTKKLEQTQQELMSARLSTNQQGSLMVRQMAVNKAQRALAEADAKLRKLKSWSQNFDSAADPIIKRMDRLNQSLNDLPKAIAYLVAVQKTLEAYAASGPPMTKTFESYAVPTAETSTEAAAPEPTSPAEGEPETASPEPALPEAAVPEPASPVQE
jgi:hypothetical protein